MCGEVYQSSTAEQCCSNNNDPQQRTANTAELSNLNPTAELSNGLAPCPAAPDQAQLPVPVPAGVREAAAGHLGRCSSAVSAQVPGYPPPGSGGLRPRLLGWCASAVPQPCMVSHTRAGSQGRRRGTSQTGRAPLRPAGLTPADVP